MRNINMNVIFCDIVSNENNSNISLGSVVDKKFHISSTNSDRTISQLSMAIFVSAIQTKNKQVLSKIDGTSVFLFSQNYDVKIRLTETISGDFTDLGEFVLEPENKFESDGLCRSVYNYSYFCLFSNIMLPPKKEKERFVIKLLIRKKSDANSKNEDWIVQNIAPIKFDNEQKSC